MIEKSSLSFCKNVKYETQRVVSDILGVGIGNSSGKHLELPSFIGKKKKEILGYIWDKVVGRIQNWNNRFLSKADT